LYLIKFYLLKSNHELDMFKNSISCESVKYSIVEIKKNSGYLYKIFTVTETNLEENEIIFSLLCEEGLLTLAKWVLKKDKRINFSTHHEAPFRRACRYNRYPTIKWLWRKSIKLGRPINIDIYEYESFRKACKNNNVKLVNWLYKKAGGVFRCRMISGFKNACDHGNILVVAWFLDKSKNMCVPPDLFKNLCRNGYLEIINMIVSAKLSIPFHYNKDQPFLLACEHGHLDIAKYLYYYDNQKIDIHIYIEYAFRMACINHHVPVAQWLKSIYPLYDFQVENKRIISFVYQ
jgi:Ankyrin repeats (many copies)